MTDSSVNEYFCMKMPETEYLLSHLLSRGPPQATQRVPRWRIGESLADMQGTSGGDGGADQGGTQPLGVLKYNWDTLAWGT